MRFAMAASTCVTRKNRNNKKTRGQGSVDGHPQWQATLGWPADRSTCHKHGPGGWSRSSGRCWAFDMTMTV